MIARNHEEPACARSFTQRPEDAWQASLDVIHRSTRVQYAPFNGRLTEISGPAEEWEWGVG